MTRGMRFTIFLTGIGAIVAWPRDLCGTTPANRTEFAKAFAAISEGMSRQEVAHLLGPPDDKWGSTAGGLEIWEYGTDGPNTLPTLGSISFDGAHRVLRVIGGSCAAPPQDMFDEQELRSLLRLVRQPLGLAIAPCPTMDPLKLIELVNSVQPLGKEKIIALAQEYCRITRPSDGGRVGLGLAFLVLFEVPDDPGFLPPLVRPPTLPAPPENLRQSPRYPIALIDDIPILLVRYDPGIRLRPCGLDWNGLDSLRDPKYRVRERRLVPKADPFGLPKALKQSQPWFFAPFKNPRVRGVFRPPSGEKVVMMQVLSLVNSVLDTPPDFDEWQEKDVQERWTATRNDFLTLRARWDEKRCTYVK